MTPAEAADRHTRITAEGGSVVWLVTISDSIYPGQAVAWAIMADPAGYQRLPGKLVAGTIDELRAILPAGLTRRDRVASMPEGAVEAWD